MDYWETIQDGDEYLNHNLQWTKISGWSGFKVSDILHGTWVREVRRAVPSNGIVL